MPKVKDVCRYVRSKNAGPFWVTVDLFFDSAESYRRYHDARAISVESFAALFQIDPKDVKRFQVDSLAVIKLSYARPQPQGGVVERDMHSGQQYVRLLEVKLD